MQALRRFVAHSVGVGQTPIQTLADQDAEPVFGHVQSTAVLRCVDELKSGISQAPSRECVQEVRSW